MLYFYVLDMKILYMLKIICFWVYARQKCVDQPPLRKLLWASESTE